VVDRVDHSNMGIVDLDHRRLADEKRGKVGKASLGDRVVYRLRKTCSLSSEGMWKYGCTGLLKVL
jgi:hypothetical protein